MTKNKLKELRKKAGLSQSDIANKLNISVKTVSRWENLETDIKPNKAGELAELLGVSVPVLLGYGYQEPLKYLVWQDNIANLRKELATEDVEKIKEATEKLTKAFYQISEKLYKDAGVNPNQGNAAGNAGEETIYDAEQSDDNN